MRVHQTSFKMACVAAAFAGLDSQKKPPKSVVTAETASARR